MKQIIYRVKERERDPLWHFVVTLKDNAVIVQFGCPQLLSSRDICCAREILNLVEKHN